MKKNKYKHAILKSFENSNWSELLIEGAMLFNNYILL